MLHHGKLLAVAGAFKLSDRHFRFDLHGQGKLALGPRVEPRAADGGQRIDIGGPIVVVVQFLVVGNLDLLFGLRRSGKIRSSKFL